MFGNRLMFKIMVDRTTPISVKLQKCLHTDTTLRRLLNKKHTKNGTPKK